MARAGSLCVLVVEDDQLVRELLVDTLRLAGHVVAEAGTAEEALELAGGLGRLDVVVADIRLPRSSGFDVLIEIRRRRPEVPAVFVTGWRPDELDVPPAVEQPYRVLPKPLGAHDLLDTIAELAPSAHAPEDGA